MSPSQQHKLPSPVQSILAYWLPQVRDLLGNDLVSAVLFGSAALDDFCEGWSDVDVCVVVAGEVSEEQGRTLGALHDSVREAFSRKPEWRSGQYIEGYYVSRATAMRSSCDDQCCEATGATSRLVRCDPILPFDRYLLSRCGVVLAGEPVLFPEPARQELAMQTRKGLADLKTFPNHSGIWLCGMLHWLARTIVFWRDREMLSKTAALRREIERGSPYHEAYELALHARIGGSATADSHKGKLLSLYPAIVESAPEEVGTYLGRA